MLYVLLNVFDGHHCQFQKIIFMTQTQFCLHVILCVILSIPYEELSLTLTVLFFYFI